MDQENLASVQTLLRVMDYWPWSFNWLENLEITKKLCYAIYFVKHLVSQNVYSKSNSDWHSSDQFEIIWPVYMNLIMFKINPSFLKKEKEKAHLMLH